MPAPTATCMICHQAVTKRSTLSLDFLGIGDGRACRSHPEIQQAMDAKAKQDKANRDMAAAESSMRVMGAISAVRVMRSFFDWPISLVVDRISRGLTDRELQEVTAYIAKHGAQMPVNEMVETVMHAQLLAERVERRHITGE